MDDKIKETAVVDHNRITMVKYKPQLCFCKHYYYKLFQHVLAHVVCVAIYVYMCTCICS